VRPTRDIPWILRELPQWLEADDPTEAAKEIVRLLDIGDKATEVEKENRIIAEMASKTGISKKQVKHFIAAFTDLAYREAKKGEFAIPGLGRLMVQKRKSRLGRNPTTGEEIKIPAKKVVKPRTSKSAKDTVSAEPATLPGGQRPAPVRQG
jgi:DNA-binding protein HU-beta